MCVPEKEDYDHWHKLDYWIEPLKLFRHLKAEFFDALPVVLNETVNIGMYRKGQDLPFEQIHRTSGPLKFFSNLAAVVEGRPLWHKPEDVYPEAVKQQEEGTDYRGRKVNGLRKIPRIGPWT